MEAMANRDKTNKEQPAVEAQVEAALVSDKPKQPRKRVVKEVAPGVTIDMTPAHKTVTGRRYSFIQWAVRRGHISRHQAGMKAFVKNPNKARTIEEWDTLFKNY